MNPRYVVWAAAVFIVFGVVDILRRQKQAEERNKALNDIRWAEEDQLKRLEAIERRLASHYPYKREVEGSISHAPTPAHPDLHVDHIVGPEGER